MMNRLCIWSFAVGWAILAVGITYLRFGFLPGGIYEVAAGVLGFFLLGFVSGGILIFLLRRPGGRPAKIGIIAGYILAIPFAYMFGIVGPLTLEIIPLREIPQPITYIILFPFAICFWGVMPPLFGMIAGLVIGKLVERIARFRTR